MNFKINLITAFLFVFPVLLFAQTENNSSKNEAVVIRKQLVTEETIYQDLVFSGMGSVYFSPVFVSNYAIQQIPDNNTYNESHYHSPSVSFGGDYRIEYNTFFLKTGLNFSWIKENKYVCSTLAASDTSYIDTASYIVNLSENAQELVSSYSIYASIPIALGKVFTINKFSILPELGVDFSFLLFASGYNGATLEDKLELSKDLMTPIIPQISAGVTVGYAIQKELWVTLCPWFNYALSPLYKGALPSYKLSTFGVRAGILIK